MKREFNDLVGKRFGRLVVIKRARDEKNGKMSWLCLCDCGKAAYVSSTMLIKGNNRSCGCLQKERAIEANTKHGMRYSRLYTIWCGMKHRCYYDKNPNYAEYGGRGIEVCSEWMEFKPFCDWSLANGYKEDLSIDRIDSNGNYTPQNCRWVDRTTQANNKTNNIKITVSGETHTLAEWSRITNIPYSVLWWRVSKGVAHQNLFKKQKEEQIIELDGERHTVSEWSKITGIKYDTIRYRLLHGWEINEALHTPSRRHKNNPQKEQSNNEGDN